MSSDYNARFHLKPLRSGAADPVVFGKESFAHADGAGGDFDKLVVGDVIDRLLEGEAARWGEEDVLVGAGGTDVGELFGFCHVDDKVVVTAVFADEHPFVDVVAWGDKEGASILKVEAGIAVRFAEHVGDEDAARAAGYGAFMGLKVFKN